MMWDLLVGASALAAALWLTIAAALVAERIHQHRTHRKARP